MFNFDPKSLLKLNELRSLGIEPYPSQACVNPADLSRILPRLQESSLSKLTAEPSINVVARLRFKNEIGSIGFGRIESNGQILQICIQKNNISKEEFLLWKKLDLGDLIQLQGTFGRTRTGELTLYLTKIQLHAKCIESMPDKHSGLQDPELKQRMRYLDLMVNLDTRERFQKRSKIISFLRRFLEDLGFMEVETPILQPIPGGANAKAFDTHHNSLDIPLYMRIAPELYLKRLLVGGFEKVFEIGKNFRNEGISTRHNPEFSMVEYYQANATYIEAMCLTTTLICHLVNSISDSMIFAFGDKEINFSNWSIIKFEDSIRKLGINDPWNRHDLIEFLKSDGFDISEDDSSNYSISKLQSLIFENKVEPYLNDPTFIIHYPVEISPLAKRNDLDSRVTDRFELFIGGYEIANGFSELNDPIDQAERFEKQAEEKSNGDDESMFFDADYIKALSYGLPICAGTGIGIDRLVMLLTNSTNIRDVILFPTRKNKNES